MLHLLIQQISSIEENRIQAPLPGNTAYERPQQKIQSNFKINGAEEEEQYDVIISPDQYQQLFTLQFTNNELKTIKITS